MPSAAAPLARMPTSSAVGIWGRPGRRARARRRPRAEDRALSRRAGSRAVDRGDRAQAARDLGAQRLDCLRHLAGALEDGRWQAGQAGDLDAEAPVGRPGLDPVREVDPVRPLLDRRGQQADHGMDQAQGGQLVVVRGRHRPRPRRPGRTPQASTFAWVHRSFTRARLPCPGAARAMGSP